MIVLLNRGDSARTLTNGLAFAGLPPGGYRDVLTDDVFTSDDDVLAVSIPARSSRVLVPR